MLWLIGKAGDSLGYVVEIDSGFTPSKGHQFRPDIQLWTKTPELQFLIEYEGTNSQDTRILWKDLQHYRNSWGSKYFPQYWLIIYTFPDHPVDAIPPWLKLESVFDETRFKRNPHRFFTGLLYNEIQDYFNDSVEWGERKIFLINFTSDGLEVDFPQHLKKKHPFPKNPS